MNNGLKILDLDLSRNYRLINVYRVFDPPGRRSQREYFTDQLATISNLVNENSQRCQIIWHFSGLTRVLHKKLKYASANALKLCTPDVTIFNTHSEIHKMADRATPMKMCQYRHAILLYRMFNSIICENEFIQMNFQLFDNARNPKIVFTRNQNYDVGKNTLLNRFCDLNNMIDKSWLEMSLDTYKVKCKELFLRTDDD